MNHAHQVPTTLAYFRESSKDLVETWPGVTGYKVMLINGIIMLLVILELSNLD